MSVLLRLLLHLAPNCHWKLTCPDTIESAAQDFIDYHLPPLEAVSAIGSDSIRNGGPGVAWRRRISAIYGVSTSYTDPRGQESKRGWNRRLWRNDPGIEPEQLVNRIF
ncbi:MAG TPA: hypothetical protein DDW52_05550 [Planctomycetaceae bacterium]|nr:hypothetical protein [Planctomycetaceae bacterium]